MEITCMIAFATGSLGVWEKVQKIYSSCPQKLPNEEQL